MGKGMHKKPIITVPEEILSRICEAYTNYEGSFVGIFKGRLGDPSFLEPYQIWSVESYPLERSIQGQTRDPFEGKSVYEVFPRDDVIGYWFRGQNGTEDPDHIVQEFGKFLEDNGIGWLSGKKTDPGAYMREDGAPPVIGIVSGKNSPVVKFWWPCQGIGEMTADTIRFEEITPEVIHYKTDLFSRIQGIVDTDYLTERIVVVVGLGSGGSLGARELVKLGVGNFRLIDFDRLETHNLTRHACSFEDIGRLKTLAVKDLLLRNNPHVHVETFEINIVDEPEIFRNAVRGADLVFVATDQEFSKYFINQVCLEERVPAVYGGVYERGFGGEIIRVIPGETACYECIPSDSTYVAERVIDYSAVTDPTQLKAEPGLGLDVAFVVLLHVKYALLTLLRGTDSELKDIPYHMCLWGNREEWIFSEPFQRIFVETKKREDCESCNADEYFTKELGLSPEEQELEAKKIIEELLNTKKHSAVETQAKRRT